MSDLVEKVQLVFRAEMRRLEIQQHDAVERNLHYMVAGAFGFGALVFANIATFLLLSERIGTIPATAVNAGILLVVAVLLVLRGKSVNSKREAELAEEMAQLARLSVEQEISDVTQLVRGLAGGLRGATRLGGSSAGALGLLGVLATQLLPALKERKAKKPG